MGLVDRLLNRKTYYSGIRDIPRLLLAGVFLSSAFIKNLDPLFFLQVVNQFQSLPVKMGGMKSVMVVYVIVGAEYVVAFAALLNLIPKMTVVMAMVLNGLFVSVLALHWGETLGVGCGCLGFPKETVVGFPVFWKNMILLVITLLAGWAAWTRPTQNDLEPKPEVANDD